MHLPQQLSLGQVIALAITFFFFGMSVCFALVVARLRRGPTPTKPPKYRARLWQTGWARSPEFQNTYALVFDKTDSPKNETPKGEPIHTVEAHTREVAFELMEAYRQKNKIFIVGEWGSGGCA